MQRLRTQTIGFKITFVSTAIVVIAANTNKIPIQLLAVPAFAAIFFDLLITSFSNSIKRVGLYSHQYLTDIMKQFTDWSKDKLLWEEFLRNYKFTQTHALLGNLGITGLSIVVAILGISIEFKWTILSIILIVILVIFYIYDIIEMNKPSKMKLEKKILSN